MTWLPLLRSFLSWFKLSQELLPIMKEDKSCRSKEGWIEIRFDITSVHTYYLRYFMDVRVCGGLVRVLDRWWS